MCSPERGSFSWLKKMTAMPRPIAALTFSSVHTWYHVGWHVPNTKSAHWNQTRRNYLEQSKWKRVCIIRLSMVKSFKAVPIEDMCSPPQILRMEICSYSWGNAPHSVDGAPSLWKDWENTPSDVTRLILACRNGKCRIRCFQAPLHLFWVFLLKPSHSWSATAIQHSFVLSVHADSAAPVAR